MNLIVCLAVAASLILLANADLSWSNLDSPYHYGSLTKSFPTYDSYRDHIKAKYYAKKAHDLAKIKSSIYGVGHGLYGFRYGSHFPDHFSDLDFWLPFIDKYPIFDFGFHDFPYFSYIPHHHFFFKPVYFPRISEHLTGFGYPQSYHDTYSHSYSYGKGYGYGKGHSYGSKHSHGYHRPHMHYYSGIKAPYTPYPKYVRKEFPGEKIIFESQNEPNSHGYRYAYAKETPVRYKPMPSHSFYGPDFLDGLKFKDLKHESSYGKYPKHSIDHESSYRKYPEHESSYRKYPKHSIEHESSYQKYPEHSIELESNYRKYPEHSIKHESSYEKYPELSVVHDSGVPIGSKFQDQGLIRDSGESIKSSHMDYFPFSKVELAGDGKHGGHSYSSLFDSGPESLKDIGSIDDVHPLNIHNEAKYGKLDASDLIAYGSEKSEAKRKDDKIKNIK